MTTARHIHQIKPIYDNKSKVLILGSFPSVSSRKQQFYYSHPQNRFWNLIAAICGAEKPKTDNEKRGLLLENEIALWDVIAECDIRGSSDSTIINVIPNDIEKIIDNTNLEAIFTNGKKAHALYQKYILPMVGINAVCLPSTSPANAAYSFEMLYECWREIKNI